MMAEFNGLKFLTTNLVTRSVLAASPSTASEAAPGSPPPAAIAEATHGLSPVTPQLRARFTVAGCRVSHVPARQLAHTVAPVTEE